MQKDSNTQLIAVHCCKFNSSSNMHKPISIHSLTNNKNNDSISSNHFAQLSTYAQSSVTYTLYLMNHTIRQKKNTNELNSIQMKQLFRKWLLTLEQTEVNTQLITALKTSMKGWIELNLENCNSKDFNNSRAGKLLKHIQSTINIFNLTNNSTAITILHCLMLHPLKNISPSLMEKQAIVYHSIQEKYHASQGHLNYKSITDQLFVANKPTKTSLKKHTCFFLGMTSGLIFATIIKFSLFGICSI